MKLNSKLKPGFTLIEVLVSLTLGMLALAGILKAFLFYLGIVDAAEAYVQAEQSASFIVQRMIRGSVETTGLRQFRVNSATWTGTSTDWIFKDSATNGYHFVKANKTIVDLKGNMVADNVVDAVVAFEVGKSPIQLSVTVEETHGRNHSDRLCQTTIASRNE